MGNMYGQSAALLTGRAACAVLAVPLLALFLWRTHSIRREYPELGLWACVLLGTVFTIFDLLGLVAELATS
jgi:hypothetical protein